jgi:hypothetical protein
MSQTYRSKDLSTSDNFEEAKWAKSNFKTPDPYSNRFRNKNILYSERKSASPSLKRSVIENNNEEYYGTVVLKSEQDGRDDENVEELPHNVISAREVRPITEVAESNNEISMVSAREIRPNITEYEYGTPQFKKSAPPKQPRVVETTTVEKTTYETTTTHAGNNNYHKDDDKETCCSGGCNIF